MVKEKKVLTCKTKKAISSMELGSSMDVKKEATSQESQESVLAPRNGKRSQIDDDYSTFSGIAFYNTIVSQTMLKPIFQMVLGACLRPYIPSKSIPATITCRGKTWEMLLHGGSVNKRLDRPGWKSLVEENGLRVGDGMFWEVLEADDEKISLKLQIIKSSRPSDFHKPEMEEVEMEMEEIGEGVTPDDPIMIV